MAIKTFPIGRTRRAKDEQSEDALEELRERMQYLVSYGPDVPGANTAGSVYVKIDADTEIPTEIYIRDISTTAKRWIGNIGSTRTSDINIVDNAGRKLPIKVLNGRVFFLDPINILGGLFVDDDGQLIRVEIVDGFVYRDSLIGNFSTNIVDELTGDLLPIVVIAGLVYRDAVLANLTATLVQDDGMLAKVQIADGKVFTI